MLSFRESSGYVPYRSKREGPLAKEIHSVQAGAADELWLVASGDADPEDGQDLGFRDEVSLTRVGGWRSFLRKGGVEIGNSGFGRYLYPAAARSFEWNRKLDCVKEFGKC